MGTISSWKTRVEKGFEKDNHKDRYNTYDATRHDDTSVPAGTDDTKSTGKGAKKRRAAIVSEEVGDAEDSEDEDDRSDGDSLPPAPTPVPTSEGPVQVR